MYNIDRSKAEIKFSNKNISYGGIKNELHTDRQHPLYGNGFQR